MYKLIESIIAKSEAVPKRLFSIVVSYILFLSLQSSRHSLKLASQTMGQHKSSFSRLLSHAGLLMISQSALGQSVKENIAAHRSWLEKQERLFIIIDATLIRRRGKKVENKWKFKQGKSYTEGHKFINVVMLIEDQPVCLSSMPFYSRQYCRKKGCDYFTENELVEQFIRLLPSSGLLPEGYIGKLCFLLDAGYDARVVQNAILEIGAHFVGSCQSRRCIDGIGIAEYFRKNRCIPWVSQYIYHSAGKRKTKRRYRVRHKAEVKLNGVGLVTAVCSETRSGDRQSKRKYLVCSDSRMSVRDIIYAYRKRWTIESWHKRMKQQHGYRDCTSSLFASIEAHVTFAVCAYNLRVLIDERMVAPRSRSEFLVMETLKEAYRCSLLFGGKKRVKKLLQDANDELLAA